MEHLPSLLQIDTSHNHMHITWYDKHSNISPKNSDLIVFALINLVSISTDLGEGHSGSLISSGRGHERLFYSQTDIVGECPGILVPPHFRIMIATKSHCCSMDPHGHFPVSRCHHSMSFNHQPSLWWWMKVAFLNLVLNYCFWGSCHILSNQ
jgi:hypothetical protein